jgi:uncharacterized delta-60 repeat protein
MRAINILIIFIILHTSITIASPSDLDTSFNGIGYENFSILGSTSSQANCVATQIDNKLIIGGQATINGTNTAIIARCNENGTLDTQFGTNGIVTFPPSTITGMTSNSIVRIAIQTDNKIIAVGFTQNSSINYLLLRYNSDGTLDTSFNTTGYFTSLFGASQSESYGLAIQPNGQILVVGTINNNQILVARHNSNGTLDTSFGSPNGYVLPPNTGIANGYTGFFGTFVIQLQSNGKIIVAASSTVSPNVTAQIIIIRLLPNGTIDSTFGTNGITTTNIGYASLPNDMLISPSDEIIIAGRSVPVANGTNQFAVAKYTAQGFLDPSFGYPNGYVTLQPTGWSNAQAWGVYTQPNGDIIATGAATINGLNNFVTMQFNAHGSLNNSINQDGLFTDNFNTGAVIKNTALQNDQKLVIAGIFTSATNCFLARYLGGIIPETVTPTITAYGYNQNFISEFLYNNFYATAITDQTARRATIAAIDAILTTYSSDYVNQPNFNYIAYLYLLESQLNAAQAILLTTYPSSTTQINQYFLFLHERMASLIKP